MFYNIITKQSIQKDFGYYNNQYLQRYKLILKNWWFIIFFNYVKKFVLPVIKFDFGWNQIRNRLSMKFPSKRWNFHSKWWNFHSLHENCSWANPKLFLILLFLSALEFFRQFSLLKRLRLNKKLFFFKLILFYFFKNWIRNWFFLKIELLTSSLPLAILLLSKCNPTHTNIIFITTIDSRLSKDFISVETNLKSKKKKARKRSINMEFFKRQKQRNYIFFINLLLIFFLHKKIYRISN